MLNEKMLFIRECSHSKCGDACTAHNAHTISRLFVQSNNLTGTSFQSFFVKIHLIKTKEYSSQSGRKKKCYIHARALIYRSMKWYKISKINARFYGKWLELIEYFRYIRSYKTSNETLYTTCTKR